MDVAATEPMPDAIESLRALSSLFDGDIWIVSKASPDTEAWSRAWMCTHGVASAEVVPVRNLVFVRERDGKRAVCQSLGITHFLDDRLENLTSLDGVVGGLYLFGADPADSDVPGGVIAVPDWPAAAAALADSVRRAVAPN